MKRLLFLALPLAAVALLVSNCTVLYDVRAEDPGSLTYPISDGYNLIEMDNKAGNVVITTEAGLDSIYIDFKKICYGTSTDEAAEHFTDIEVSIVGTTSDSTIRITTDFPNIDTRKYQAEFEIRIPDTMNLDIVNTSGNVEITGMARQPQRLETTSGSITIKGFNCGIDAKATTGNISCEIVNLPSNKSVNLETVSGTTTLDVLAMDTTNALDITGESGDIVVTLPSTVQLSFDLQTTSGKVTINGFVPEHGTTWGNTHQVGTIGTSDTKSTLKAVTESGNVTLNQGN